MKKFFTAVVIGGFMVVLTQTAHGAGGMCTITATDIGRISAIQNDPTLSSIEEVKEELAVRKQLIARIIDCGKNDAQILQSTLQNTTMDAGSKNLQAALVSKFDDVINFYNIEHAKLDGAGIASSQSIAKELFTWRTDIYNPLAAEVNNFILWSQNQNLFNTAQTRMAQTQHAVDFLEGISANAELESAMSAAQASFSVAESANMDAKNSLAESLPADQSLGFIKQSLDALSDTYQKFSAVSALIKTLLPQ